MLRLAGRRRRLPSELSTDVHHQEGLQCTTQGLDTPWDRVVEVGVVEMTSHGAPQSAVSGTQVHKHFHQQESRHTRPDSSGSMGIYMGTKAAGMVRVLPYQSTANYQQGAGCSGTGQQTDSESC